MVWDLVDLAICLLDGAVEGRASDQLGGGEYAIDQGGCWRMLDVLLRLPMPGACQ